MAINIKIENKHIYLISAIVVLMVGIGVVISANPSSKVNPGHDSTDVMINIGGSDKTLQQAIDNGDFDTEGLVIWGNIGNWMTSGGHSGNVVCNNIGRTCVGVYTFVEGLDQLIYTPRSCTLNIDRSAWTITGGFEDQDNIVLCSLP